MGSEAARALAALDHRLTRHSDEDIRRMTVQDVHHAVIFASGDIEREDAERADQENTPEAYAAKEQWVRAICDKQIAAALREFASELHVRDTRPDLCAIKVADKLNPRKRGQLRRLKAPAEGKP